MNIKDIHVKPSSITSPISEDNECKLSIVCYNITITYHNGTQKEITTYTDMIQKEDFKGYHFGKTYFIITDNEHHIYNSEGEETTSIPLHEGELIKTSNQYFLLIKGITISKYNNNGILVAQRTLSPNEIDNFDKTKQLSLSLSDNTTNN